MALFCRNTEMYFLNSIKAKIVVKASANIEKQGRDVKAKISATYTASGESLKN
jgi:hypothetical protein